jgi:hypothetical protein
MSQDFSPENLFPNPIDFGNIRFYSHNLTDFNGGAGLTKINSRELDTNQSLTLPYRSYQPLERLPEILQQLHSFKPLCSSGNQHQLARKALTALNNRKKEDIRNLAKMLADDVAGTVD